MNNQKKNIALPRVRQEGQEFQSAVKNTLKEWNKYMVEEFLDLDCLKDKSEKKKKTAFITKLITATKTQGKLTFINNRRFLFKSLSTFMGLLDKPVVHRSRGAKYAQSNTLRSE